MRSIRRSSFLLHFHEHFHQAGFCLHSQGHYNTSQLSSMYRTALVLALSVLSTALPQPQAATSGDVTTTQAASCPAQPAGAGPVTSPDTDTAFLANNIYSDAANNAVTPSGYMRSFVNLKAATSGSGYLGFSSIGAYNPQTCANLCANTFGCNAFNICKNFTLYGSLFDDSESMLTYITRLRT